MTQKFLHHFTAFTRLSFHFFVLILLTTFFQSTAMAQKSAALNVEKLAVSFSIVNNNYQNKNQALAKFILTNNGKKVLPATGWKIYFNIKSMIGVENTADGLVIKKQTGNLFELSPTAAFTGIKPGGSYSTQMITDRIINKNDQPEGFYLVWNNEPTKGYTIKNLSINKPALQPTNGKLVSDFAETIYNRNTAIKRAVNNNLPKVFPTPASYEETSGGFLLDNNITITTDKAFEKEAALLAADLENVLGEKPPVNIGSAAKGIILKMKEGLVSEGYELNINNDVITITASSGAGIFYGIQSFKTILPTAAWSKKQGSIQVPAVNIADAPRFGYRGFMLDVARNFQTKEEVLRVLELMSLYKLNTFHFHITEDEGWRLEIDGLPELTSVGANRGHTLDDKNNLPAAYGSGPETGKLYGSRYYTKADFIEILQYANDRHIQVITEIETPGHARAAIKAMDNRYERLMKQGKKEQALQYLLRDTLDVSEYSTAQWYTDNVMNVALPSVYTFIEKVITEVDKLYKQAGVPLTNMHFGGDEVPAGVWEKSPACAELVKNDPSLNEINDLWYYYYGRVHAMLKSRGIALSGWEEMGMRKTEVDGKKTLIPNPGFANNDLRLYVWNNTEGNEDLAYKLANAGYKIILTPVTNFYFDMIAYGTYDEPGYYWGSITDISKTYQFIPFDYLKNVHTDKFGNALDRSTFTHKQRLTEYGKSNVLGLQAAIWSETIKGPQQMEYMLLPRLSALAERAWAKDPEWANETDDAKMKLLYNNEWSSFVQSMSSRQLPLLEKYNGGYNYRIPPAGAIIENGAVLANTQFPNHIIRFTTDGSEPSNTSAVYNGPVTTKGIIKLKVFSATGGESYLTIIENK